MWSCKFLHNFSNTKHKHIAFASFFVKMAFELVLLLLNTKKFTIMSNKPFILNTVIYRCGLSRQSNDPTLLNIIEKIRRH